MAIDPTVISMRPSIQHLLRRMKAHIEPRSLCSTVVVLQYCVEKEMELARGEEVM
jgi:hypothetical protein